MNEQKNGAAILPVLECFECCDCKSSGDGEPTYWLTLADNRRRDCPQCRSKNIRRCPAARAAAIKLEMLGHE